MSRPSNRHASGRRGRRLGFEMLEDRRLLAPIQWPVEVGGNGHWYDFMPGSETWHVARNAAANTHFMGIPGHLATITTPSENAFLNENFSTRVASYFAWIGGFEPLDNGVWRWFDGAEAGIQFSNYVDATPPFNYVNWGGIEPNDNNPNEDFLMYNLGRTFAGIGPGQWADATPIPSAADPVVGYLVEYAPPVVRVVTHGFSPAGTLPEWVDEMATALCTDAEEMTQGVTLCKSCTHGYDVVVAFDWAAESNDPVPGVTIAEGGRLARRVDDLVTLLATNDTRFRGPIDLHLIGHSRGSVVISQAAHQIQSPQLITGSESKQDI